MPRIPDNYIEKAYAGWLGKIIGIRHGAQTEGWTAQKISEVYGEITDYPVDYREFAADDDSNVPLFLLRALDTSEDPQNLQPQEVADALLNYAPYEHGFFWWGGYGVSTEHTAYLNLRHGIPAPRSGSSLQNGLAVAEQIGGQIFIDPWGLVAPANPELAARLARAAASVTHDGNGVYGGVFIAVCISLAFTECETETIIAEGLRYIPENCAYTQVVRAVIDFYHRDENRDWRACYEFIHQNYGYDKYPGSCHIIPNAALIILSLLYGGDSFDDTINICNMCGWDADCNVSNVAVITAVRLGLESIDYDRWRKPINDFYVCSSVIGDLNIMDIPRGASLIARLAYRIAGEQPPAGWGDALAEERLLCHFEYPGSTHAMRARSENGSTLEYQIRNTTRAARSGERSLRFFARRLAAGRQVYLYQKSHCRPKDFHDSRYDPCFSPLVYPGQTLTGSVYLEEAEAPVLCQMYVYDGNGEKIIEGPRVPCVAGEWVDLQFQIPRMEGACLEEWGFAFTRPGGVVGEPDLMVYVDDLEAKGAPNYTVDFARERMEPWPCPHREISQFTALKGVFDLEEGWLNLSCSDFAEVYTGGHNWSDYCAAVTLSPQVGAKHRLNLRVRGAAHSYAVGLEEPGLLTLCKNDGGYRVLQQAALAWKPNGEYRIEAKAEGNSIRVCYEGRELLDVTDNDAPYLTGGVGFSVEDGSRCRYCDLDISPLEDQE